MTRLSAGDAELEIAVLGRVWRFGRGDGSVITPHLRLLRGGELRPRQHRNEHAWRIHQGALEFITPEGHVTCRFDTVGTAERGAMALQGSFRLISGVTHTLREIGSLVGRGQLNANPRVALLVRTHLVNGKLFDLLDLLNQSRRYDLFVTADETRGPLDVSGYKKLSHTVDSCRIHGLSTAHQAILWHCGDYPLYLAAAAISDYDYYVMIEYDVDLVRKSPLFLEGLIARLPDSGADFVAEGVHPAHPDWSWASTAGHRFPAVYSSGIFAFVMVSKRALEYLLELRRVEARSGVTENDIVHCEAFCVSALMQGGYTCTAINSLLDGAVDTATFHATYIDNIDGDFLLNQYRIDNPRVEIVHPVYDLKDYLERLYHKSVHSHQLEGYLAKLESIDTTRQGDADLVARFQQLALVRQAGHDN